MKAAFQFLAGAIFLLTLPFFNACKRPAPVAPTASSTSPQRPARPLQSQRASAPLRTSETRTWDLLHTRLEVEFDWTKKRLMGRADLTATPFFYPQTDIVFDAKGFEIHAVTLNGDTLPYEYDLRQLRVSLPDTFRQGRSLTLQIDYTARPYELEVLGLQEDADDHGLYFINADGSQPNYPQQIWTQGETEANSCWFPTFDQPNERCTQEMFITVEDRFKTLSNGVLEGSESLPGGKRRDHWQMRQPHAPYLFMMAIGEFAVVKEEWRGKEVSYWVEPKYEPYAKLIFGNTPEMLEFFSDRLGVEYPWDKYAQVVVREFVSGAMENTSATIHFDALQHDDRRHIDATMEEFISHELFHQWFGDMVTCESWSHLTLNEAFATYGEFLWIEHKYGDDEAARHFLGDRQNYFYEASRRIHPLIHFRYDSRDGMFDSHSYQKGGQVLHMLRHEVGDAAFFASLEHYLKKNAFSDVEADELRLAFEEVTGRDLRWFFDQWFFSAGHPQLRVEHNFKPGVYQLHVTQLQDSADQPVFRFPVTVQVATGFAREEKRFWVSTRDTVLEFRAAFPPDMVDFNSDGVLLAEVQEEKSMEMWRLQFELGANYHQRRAALLAMENELLVGNTLDLLRDALNDDYWGMQLLALGWADNKPAVAVQAAVVELLWAEEAAVRSNAVLYFRDLELEDLDAAVRERLLEGLAVTTGDRSYNVQQNSLLLLNKLDPKLGQERANALIPEAEGPIPAAIAMILARGNADGALAYIAVRLERATEAAERVAMVRALGVFWEKHSSTEGQSLLMGLAESDPVWWVRLTAGRTLTRMDKTEKLNAFYKERAEKEEVGMVKDFWKNQLD